MKTVADALAAGPNTFLAALTPAIFAAAATTDKDNNNQNDPESNTEPNDKSPQKYPV